MTPAAAPRERLLAAARELSTRRGFDAVSVRDLTARARVNLGAVTYHFKSKQALYHEAIASIARPFADAVAAVAAEPGAPLDRIEGVVRAVLAHLAQHPEAPPIMLRELAGNRPLPPPLADLMRRNVGVLTGIIADGQRDGSIRKGDPALFAFSVISQPFFFRVAGKIIEKAAGIDERDPRVWARVVDHVASSIRRTIANTPQAS